MKQPLIRKELDQDLRAEAERRLQLAQSGTQNGSIATPYALLAIHDTMLAIHDTLIKIEDHLRSGMGREAQTPAPASQPTPASQDQITAA